MKMILTSLIVILMEFCFLKNGKNILLKNIRNFKLFFQLENQDMMNKSKSCNYLKFINYFFYSFNCRCVVHIVCPDIIFIAKSCRKYPLKTGHCTI